jgi:predicted O-methyltransferase YrrM
MDNLDHILNKFNLTVSKKARINIRDIGRNDLAVVFNELGFKTGAEIGTEAGKYAQVLCQAIPGLKLYCIDPWLDYDDGGGYKDSVTQAKFNQYLQETKTRLTQFDCEIIRDFSMNAVKKFEDNSLDFVYIDGNHRLDYVVNDLVWWTEKVRPGGIVAGHDYIKLKKQNNSHVPYALEAYTKAYNIFPWFVLDQKNGHKSEAENKYMDRIRSWFFVKQ